MKRYHCFFILLLCSLIGSAQTPFAEDLQKQFYQYQRANPQEKLFVHTDKTFYLAGETIWFKVYDVDESFHRPLGISSIAYFEVISEEHLPALRTKIYLKNGYGNGSISLPTTLRSGNYILRTYTSWMKNFSSDFFYEQGITIVNTLKGKAPSEAVKKTRPAIRFFPEGGNLVYGLSSKIAFKATGPDGKGIYCSGSIINQKNDTLSRFHSLHNGMGNFLLTPQKNDSYYAIVKLEDTAWMERLPDVYNDGFTFSLSEPIPGKLRITVHATEKFYNTIIYLLVHSRHVIKNSQSGKLQNGEAVFLVDKKDLGDGISTFTLFDALRQPVCERLFFKRPEKALVIGLKTDQTLYNQRKPVTLDILTGDNEDQSHTANLSVSVLLLDSLQHMPEENIRSYFLLSSDLKGVIESPEYYLEPANEETDQALDNLLLTQGWRRFKWEDVFKNKRPAFEFLPEIEGPVINGKIEDKYTGLPAPSVTFTLTVPGSHFLLSSATSNSEGIIRFPLQNFYNYNNTIILQPANPGDSNYRIDITHAYSDKFPSRNAEPLTIPENLKEDLLKRSIGMQAENIYDLDKKRIYIPAIADSISFYGKPDRLYHLEDYTRFVTMEEVMREYVDDVRVRKEGTGFRFRVRNLLFNTFFDHDPLILLDGLPVFDATKIMALDPQRINNIEVVSRRFYLGSSIAEGIVSIKSNSSDLGASQLDPNAILLEYDGLQQQREFYSPSYQTNDQQNSPIPDFRNVLLWSPNVVTDRYGKTKLLFYTSDVTGKYAVIIQGISQDGLPGKAVSRFEVEGSK